MVSSAYAKRLFVLAVCGVALVLAAAPGAQAGKRPNILIILTDDQRTGTTAVMPKTRTWFGAGGTHYPRALVTTPSCCPSRASILSGRYVHNHGVTQQGGIGNFDHEQSLQGELKQAGYRTAAIGKLFNRWNLWQRPPHFDRWALQGGGYVDAFFVVDGVGMRVPYATTFIGDQARRYISGWEEQDERPWFLYLGPTAPHHPFTAEEKYAIWSFPWHDPNPATTEADRWDKPAYVRNSNVTLEIGADEREKQLRTLLSVDDMVDRVMRHLDAEGELDDTLAFFLSDNGYLWAEHGLRGKFVPYTQSLDVPLFVRWPGEVPDGVVDQRVAANIDVTPTALEAARVNPSYEIDGKSLLAPWVRPRSLHEYWYDSANGGFPTWASLRTATWQYTEYYGADGNVFDREYYDLVRDPWQLLNVYRDGNAGNDPPTRLLSADLARARSCRGTSCP